MKLGPDKFSGDSATCSRMAGTDGGCDYLDRRSGMVLLGISCGRRHQMKDMTCLRLQEVD